MKKQNAEEMFRVLDKLNPNPETELEYTNNFQLLVAVVLSAQATDISVNKATSKIFNHIKTPVDLLNMGLENFRNHIKTIGLFNTKAKNVLSLCADLQNKFGGKIPETRQELESLAGVGRKTANVVLNTAFGQATIAVDTHVFRVGNRTGLAVGKTVLEVEKKLMKAIPKQYFVNSHHLLILHGRYICKAKNPDCAVCPIAHICKYKGK